MSKPFTITTTEKKVWVNNFIAAELLQRTMISDVSSTDGRLIRGQIMYTYEYHGVPEGMSQGGL